jgi:acyl-CoA thioesterase I
LLDLRRGTDGIKVINAGVSGDTTSQIISRFLGVALQQPDWVICNAGTNDARLHGTSPTKVLVSPEETEKNLKMLRSFAATQTSARWVWMTPATVIEDKIAAFWFLPPYQMMIKNKDLVAVAEVVRRQPDPVVDVQAVFGLPPSPELLLFDGLHPSLVGQKVIVKALVERLSSLP